MSEPETEFKVAIRSFSGSECVITPGSHWTCRHLKAEVKKQLGVDVGQQCLIHGLTMLPDDFAVEQMRDLCLGSSMTLDVTLRIRSWEAAVMLFEVQLNAMALREAPVELKSDKEIVLQAVKWDGYALQFASEELRGDKDTVLQAVNRHGWALQFASEELRGDKDIVLQAVKRHGGALQFASRELRGDKDIALQAVKRHVGALQFASEELRRELRSGRLSRRNVRSCS